ncbi:MAG: hypothetical protein JWQ27_243 [Ferruginibacter sp.]|nr:hypothetical protein [Ferruginibacter sp.]
MKKKDFFVWLFIALAAGFLVFWHFYRKDKIQTQGILLTCKIVSITSNFRSAPSFQCEVIFKGQKLIVGSNTNVDKNKIFIGKHFPIMYSSEINKGQILVTPNNFAEMGIPFPDSLKWVLQYEN